MHLPVCYLTVDVGGYRVGTKPGWSTGLSVSYKRCAQTHTGEKVVHGARSYYFSGWSPTVCQYFHRDVSR